MEKTESFLKDASFVLSFAPWPKSRIGWNILLHTAKAIPIYCIPLLIKLIIDSFIPSADFRGIWIAVIAAFVLGLCNIFFHAVSFSYGNAGTWKSLALALQYRMAESIQQAEQSVFETFEKGRLFTKIVASVKTIHNFFSGFIDSGFGALLSFFWTAAVFFIIEPALLGLTLLIIPVFSILRQMSIKKMKATMHERRIAHENLGQAVSLFIQSAFLSRVHGEEQNESIRLEKKNRGVMQVSRTVIGTMAAFGSLAHSFNQGMYLVMIFLCSLFVIRERLLIGEMVLFLLNISLLINSLFNLINIYPQYLEFREAVHAVREITALSPGKINTPDAGLHACTMSPKNRKLTNQSNNIQGDLRFENVVFGYEKDRPILNNFNLHVLPGTSVGIIGESGTGKTTLMKLLLGLYTPWSGTVRIDGIPLEKWNMHSVRRAVSVVQQDPVFFKGTVCQNVTHGDTVPDFKKLKESLVRADAWEFVQGLAGGTESIVEEEARNFSGGQKQRLAIARALYRMPAIMLFDEASSALDGASEKNVQSSIEKMHGHLTQFIIAHRLSTIARADMIVVLQEGVAAEKGTHRELIRARGIYASLLSRQLNIPVEELE